MPLGICRLCVAKAAEVLCLRKPVVSVTSLSVSRKQWKWKDDWLSLRLRHRLGEAEAGTKRIDQSNAVAQSLVRRCFDRTRATTTFDRLCNESLIEFDCYTNQTFVTCMVWHRESSATSTSFFLTLRLPPTNNHSRFAATIPKPEPVTHSCDPFLGPRPTHFATVKALDIPWAPEALLSCS